GPMQDLSGKVQAGYVYTLSARIKYEAADSPATKQFFATMHYGGGTYTNLVSVTATRGQWATFSGSFTIPADQNVTTARIFFETPWTSAPADDPTVHLMDFKLDDVTLTGAPPPPPPPPRPPPPRRTTPRPRPESPSTPRGRAPPPPTRRSTSWTSSSTT